MQALAMRLDLQLSTDQERQLLESCVLHSEAPSAMPRRSTRTSHPGSPMRRSVSGLLAGGVSRSTSGQLLGAPNSVSVLDRQTSFGRQNSFYNVATPPQGLPAPPQSLPAIQARFKLITSAWLESPWREKTHPLLIFDHKKGWTWAIQEKPICRCRTMRSPREA